ncbi:MAG: polyprenyl synthetase family protein [Spirochaetaceae bacterium]|jgi:octaprenyl-diphosphate synthase|nr:polyprenyl synthetase family protein [Spirochaetaceae bacterium]
MDAGYRARLEKIEERINAALPENPGGTWLTEYIAPGLIVADGMLRSLAEPGRDLLSRGGKRWRPLFQVLVCEALGGGGAALPLVPLVELPHNASLIHDDIEDHSDTRRGKPAAHISYGEDRAINSGSFLYFLPLSCIDRWDAPAERKAAAYALWAEHLRRLHLGQAMDIAWHRERGAAPGAAEYETMCRLKTGSLARLAAALGVCAAGRLDRSAAPEGGPGDAAERLGVGFQILDDVKNLTTGNPGKKRGDDIVEGKKSLPAILFLEKHPEKAALVTRCFQAARVQGVDADEVEELIGEFARAGVIEEAAARGAALLAEAQDILARTGSAVEDAGRGGDEPPSRREARRLLAGFTDLLA